MHLAVSLLEPTTPTTKEVPGLRTEMSTFVSWLLPSIFHCSRVCQDKGKNNVASQKSGIAFSCCFFPNRERNRLEGIDQETCNCN